MNNASNFVSLNNKHHEFITALKIVYSKHVGQLLQNQLKARLGDQTVLSDQGEGFKLQKSKYQNEAGAIHRREYLEKSVMTLEKSLDRRVL